MSILVLVAAAALAAAPAPAAQSAPPPTLSFLTEADIIPQRLLPAPPNPKAELAELRRIGRHTTRARWRQAMWDYENEDGTIFRTVLGPAYDLKGLPATARLLAEVRNEEAIAAGKAKYLFLRPRPWAEDPSLRTCSRNERPNSSYPSGHATMAYAMAVVLSEAMPDRAATLMARAADYSESRLVCAMHHRSDIVAGQALGTLVAVQLLHNDRFRQDLAAAHAELAAAGLTRP